MLPIWNWLDKLYLPPGKIHLIRRLVGVWLLGILPLEFYWTTLAGPYPVPGWRFGSWALEIPAAGLAIDLIGWLAYALAAIWLVRGDKNRLYIAVPILMLVYFGSRERMAFACTFVIILFLYLVALLFYREPVSVSRRLIQIAVSSCYLFAAVTKLHPEFLNGNSFGELFEHCFTLRKFWCPILEHLSIPHEAYAVASWGVIACELFLAIGLWLPATRKAAMISGIILHAGIEVFIEGIDIFAAVMWTGYLAFLPDTQEAKEESVAAPKWEKLLAALVIAIMLWMPIRFFLPLGPSARPFDRLSYLDHGPWGFAMFIFREDVESVTIHYMIGSDTWKGVTEIKDRMQKTSSDDELFALAKYVLREHPDASQVKITTVLKINSKITVTKTCLYSRSESGPREVTVSFQ